MWVIVEAVKSRANIVMGKLGGIVVENMLDSLIIALTVAVQYHPLPWMLLEARKPLEFLTALGEEMTMMEHIRTSIRFGALGVSDVALRAQEWVWMLNFTLTNIVVSHSILSSSPSTN